MQNNIKSKKVRPFCIAKGHLLFLYLAIVMILTGCTISIPGPTIVPVRPTTLADVWYILEQRPLLIPPLPQNKSCSTTNDTVMPYTGFTTSHEIITPVATDIPFASPKTFANGQPNPHNNGWYLQKVLWRIQPPYQGPILVRGHQIGGPHIMQFNGGLSQRSFTGDWANAPLTQELQLMGSTQNDAPNGWPTYTRVQVPSCFIYQVDGLSFSGYFIFQAVFEQG